MSEKDPPSTMLPSGATEIESTHPFVIRLREGCERGAGTCGQALDGVTIASRRNINAIALAVIKISRYQ
jgi:hypothetical protein